MPLTTTFRYSCVGGSPQPYVCFSTAVTSRVMTANTVMGTGSGECRKNELNAVFVLLLIARHVRGEKVIAEKQQAVADGKDK